MKYLLFILIALPTLSFSQKKFESKKKVYPLAIFTNPEFIGGQHALDNYILENLKINRKDKRLNTTGEISVKFFIGTDGSILTPTLLNKGLSKQLNKEALRVIANMPKWKPATKNGEIVKTMYAYIITIK
jgi:hypothetical protein